MENEQCWLKAVYNAETHNSQIASESSYKVHSIEIENQHLPSLKDLSKCNEKV